MEFGIWSNGFRRATTPAQTYEEDLYEIVLADKLGCATPISASTTASPSISTRSISCRCPNF